MGASELAGFVPGYNYTLLTTWDRQSTYGVTTGITYTDLVAYPAAKMNCL
jgi:hypothetical protein